MSIFRRKNKRLNDVEFGLLDANSPFALKEAYSSLFTNIVYIGIEDKCKKLVITSAMPAEGKSTVSANLALTIAENVENPKVLLIDSDLRAPKLNQLFGIEDGTRGFSEYLAGVDDEPNFIYLEDKKITILTSGAKSLNPTQLLSSSMMSRFFSDYENCFDYIIIDTPPVNIVTDALMYNSYCNGYIVSVRSNYSDTKSISDCINRINQVGGEVIGFVYSGAKLKRAGGRYEYSNRYNK